MASLAAPAVVPVPVPEPVAAPTPVQVATPVYTPVYHNCKLTDGAPTVVGYFQVQVGVAWCCCSAHQGLSSVGANQAGYQSAVESTCCHLFVLKCLFVGLFACIPLCNLFPVSQETCGAKTLRATFVRQPKKNL